MNLRVEIDEDVVKQADRIFSELGLDMTTAVNLFLEATIRENGVPFPLRIDVPNETTSAAIEEGRRIADDPDVKGYSSVEELKAALEI